jgi:catechol 2,3-dioxygenase-like lactoylglutathione lyase family enzyme
VGRWGDDICDQEPAMADPTPPTLDQINLVVGDMERSADFYRLLGLPIDGGDASWDPHHRSVESASGGDFDLDSAAFAATWNHGLPSSEPRVVIGFRVADRDAVDALYAELVGAGHPSQQAPYDAFWGARYAIVEDPDGHSVGLMSPVDPERRTRGPKPPD